MVRGKREEEMERIRQRVCVSPVYVFGDPHSEAWACDLFQNTNVSLISTALKKIPCWDCRHTHTHTLWHVHTNAYMYLYTHSTYEHTHSHINIVASPQLSQLIYAHTPMHTPTHTHTPGCLIYFNYNQIHRDPITKIEGYLCFSVHPKRLIKFSCKDEIIWYNTNVFSFS